METADPIGVSDHESLREVFFLSSGQSDEKFRSGLSSVRNPAKISNCSLCFPFPSYVTRFHRWGAGGLERGRRFHWSFRSRRATHTLRVEI